ncbi:hypothetical protein PAAG_05688 [Paracoccidioides lutzii Pb01]|uniref:Cation efflux protein transmembrane domain-containing protein n=1 Tax=Paracoccidioides lutzii (strain ATCC MYA-826 / Pb01) TaxID=502779 RepID=C1H4J5_PARBA|nr:hypothetical protein PAAG_05688 [Paracoccidioides lutzii Pb01]EEH34639.2 hypothetical protein PAAG_05688 [Paracoccidioides lutzii Pb01]
MLLLQPPGCSRGLSLARRSRRCWCFIPFPPAIPAPQAPSCSRQFASSGKRQRVFRSSSYLYSHSISIPVCVLPSASFLPRQLPSYAPRHQYHQHRQHHHPVHTGTRIPSTNTTTSRHPLPRPHLSALPLFTLMTTPKARSHGHQSHGHSHSHSHCQHHDTTYLLSTNKSDAAVRITRIGLLSNLLMALSKGIGGYFFNSTALIADAYHSLTDLLSDFMTLGTVSLSLKPPSSRFPLGYGKVESLGALGVSGLLLCGGFLMGLNAVEVLATQFFPAGAEWAGEWGLLGHGHLHSHGHGDHGGHGHGPGVLGPNINAAWLAAGSILVKESLYQATMKIALQRKSSVLASNAIHHRVDSLTSFVALLTIGGAHVLPDASWLDPVGGLVISLMIIKAGWGNTKTSLLELVDVSVDAEMRESVESCARKAVEELGLGRRGEGEGEEGEVQIRDVRGIKSGQNYVMEVDVVVPGAWSVSRTRAVEDAIRERLGKRVRGVKRVKVRFLAKEDADANAVADEFITRDVSPRSSPEPESESEENEEHTDRNGVVVSSGAKGRGEGVANKRL